MPIDIFPYHPEHSVSDKNLPFMTVSKMTLKNSLSFSCLTKKMLMFPFFVENQKQQRKNKLRVYKKTEQ